MPLREDIVRAPISTERAMYLMSSSEPASGQYQFDAVLKFVAEKDLFYVGPSLENSQLI